LYTIMFLFALAIIAALLVLIRYLAIDPGFRIWTRAAGELSLWLSYPFRRVTLIYGDVDSLGKVNDALTAEGMLGHDRFNYLMRSVLRQMRGTDKALVYGGDELRIVVPEGLRGGKRSEDNARLLCIRFQSLLLDAPLTEAERARLGQATGYDHLRITLAFESRVRYSARGATLRRAKAAVGLAKPKTNAGRRGEVLSCNS